MAAASVVATNVRRESVVFTSPRRSISGSAAAATAAETSAAGGSAPLQQTCFQRHCPLLSSTTTTVSAPSLSRCAAPGMRCDTIGIAMDSSAKRSSRHGDRSSPSMLSSGTPASPE